ncbi:HEAT repeat protein [Dictyocaulus viviparus]|uniref:HEAT repeat protein n=1 Tax=Dictyocaulus viviparus TaxID=29172 RepID=A0A0D8XHP0_DICVI|nr:HEAT repeat protein [Dictyocaulus viviparus]
MFRSKNNTVRTSCASFVGTLVSRLGTSTVLSSPEQLARLIPQLIAFSRDPNPHVRMHGRQTLLNLSEDPNFDRHLKKSVSDTEYQSVKSILEEIGKKGGLDSLDSTCSSISSGLSRSGSVRKTVQRKLPDNVQLDLDEIRADLTATSWERRVCGLKRFEELCGSTTKAVASDTKLIEAFIGRLSDINSKVSLEGLDIYLITLPALSRFYSTESHLKAVLNQLILALMSHLSSKNVDHRSTAQKCLTETIEKIDPSCLSPAIAAAARKANIKQKPFMLGVLNNPSCLSPAIAAAARKANIKQKPFMLGVLNSLNCKLYPMKPKQVEVVALPILWECLKAGVAESEMRKAVAEYAKGLVELMGEKALLDHSSMEVNPSKRKLLESLIL